ncbi:unnamed protein product [Rotaria sp. Silwood2]|nr:unnamed protein product [Rotaria sp. Silwood2]CAF2753536.1 unnamed protein product [Rotaria sp. Silwood2]CAF3197075.1 unnamed protein product [Rotaria sp. Silwood2]CAF3935117.1 unnamed protein product [Rotaria sp. Silwood2]CAF4163692.1 unnamed protein product [Rotaria sp. Silwood2]
MSNILYALDHPCLIIVHDIYDILNTVYSMLELVEHEELFDRIVAKGQLAESTTKTRQWSFNNTKLS